MHWYRVRLRGENFLLNLTGEPELLAFRVTYYVKAGGEQEAERMATILMRQEPRLRDHTLNIQQNPTRVVCESVKRTLWKHSRQHGCYNFWQLDVDMAETPVEVEAEASI